MSLLLFTPPLQCNDCNLPNCNSERHRATNPFVYPVCSACGIELMDLMELYEKPALRSIHSCEICFKRYRPDDDANEHFNSHFSKLAARTTTKDVMLCISCFFDKGETLKKNLSYFLSKPIAKIKSEKRRYVPKALPMLDARVSLIRLPDSQIPSLTRNVKVELADETDFLVFSNPLSPSFGHTEDTNDVNNFNSLSDAFSGSSDETPAPRKKSNKPFVETTRVPNANGKFGCSLCEYSVILRRNLMHHERVIHNINNESNLPLGCPKCPRRFQEKKQLSRHQSRFHKVELTDKSDYLDAFTGSSDQTPSPRQKSSKPFVETVRVPNVDGKFGCSLCEYSVIVRGNLMHHERVIHNINNESNLPFGCPKCPRRFEKKKQFSRHQLRFHKVELGDESDNVVLSHPRSPSFAHTEDNMNDDNNYNSLSDAFSGRSEQDLAMRNKPSKPIVETTQIPNADGKFGCSLCKYSAALRRNLMQHERVKHNINNDSKLPFECPKCSRRFEEKRHLRRHQSRFHRVGKKVVERQKWKCRACDLPPFANAQKREEHENCVHLNAETKRWSCRSCSLSFLKPVELRAHEFLHTGIRPYVCEKCGFTTKRKEHIEKHLYTHTDDRPVVCDLCPEKSFKTITRLKVHIKSFHQRKYKYPCEKCDRVFTYQSDKRRHVRSHGGVEKKFACVLCEKRFYEPKDLRLHMKSH